MSEGPGPGHAPWPFGLNDLDVCGVPPRTRCLRRSLRPEVRDARASEGVTIAYPVAGDGPVTMVVVPPLISQLELAGEEPAPEHFWSRFAACARVALSDRRGGMAGSFGGR